jgi:hypothetical protein
MRPHQLLAAQFGHATAEGVAYLPTPARAAAAIVVEEAAPPSSNGPPAMRPADLATILDRLR